MSDNLTLVVVGDDDVGKSALAVRVCDVLPLRSQSGVNRMHLSFVWINLPRASNQHLMILIG